MDHGARRVRRRSKEIERGQAGGDSNGVARRVQGQPVRLSPFAALAVASCGWAFAAEPVRVTPEMRIVADHITAASLRGHVSFLASDLLEGRDTPSRGLDIAAEYIAAQFRRAGLEPKGDDGYFQTAKFKVIQPGP